ncbi:MAG: flagellar basal body rod protein FlgC [Armatimonadetes bacterium]|nr:flagellar basal body rod protein FlgC [Armatimonadota bacterium]
MNLNTAFRTSASGMTAERFRMDVIASNIANANSTRVNGQDPYRRRIVELTTGDDGVEITKIMEDQSEFRQVYEPGNPNANKDGVVFYSNVDPLKEVVDMTSATRAYEANIAAFNSTKSMLRAALSIGKV